MLIPNKGDQMEKKVGNDMEALTTMDLTEFRSYTLHYLSPNPKP